MGASRLSCLDIELEVVTFYIVKKFKDLHYLIPTAAELNLRVTWL
jgi:hypothetical protein